MHRWKSSRQGVQHMLRASLEAEQSPSSSETITNILQTVTGTLKGRQEGGWSCAMCIATLALGLTCKIQDTMSMSLACGKTPIYPQGHMDKHDRTREQP